MRCALLWSVPFCLLGLPMAAHATTITAGVYTLQGASAGGYTVTGTVTVDATGAATTANLSFNDPNVSVSGYPTFNQVSQSSVYNGLSQNYLTNSGNTGQVALFLNTTADAQGWFDLCLTGVQCGTASGTVNPSWLQVYGFYNSSTNTSNPGLGVTNFSSGYLTASASTATAVTPEPSTVMLLATGLLGFAGLAVRNAHGPNALREGAM